ncbi:hypothetical protein [Bordetella sp. 2513F-2]
MQKPANFRFVPLCGALALGATLLSGAASAQGAATGSSMADIDAQYRLDVQRCNSGQTDQDRTSCLREAGAARDEARRGRLMRGESDASRQQNALERCNRLPAGQREDCVTATTSPTKTYGSVGGGGVLRESVITVPADTGTMAPAGTTAPGTPLAPPAMPPAGSATPAPVR